MIPHHSIAVPTGERSEIPDVRVCESAVAIIEAQRREIGENGAAEARAEAAGRPVPEHEGTPSRICGSG
jgi:hypothetical protein